MEIKLNLASKPYLNRQSVRLWLLLSCAILLLLLLLNCLYGYQNYRQLSVLDGRFQELDGQISGLQETPEGYTPEKYASVRDEVSLANEIVAADQFRWTTLLSKFEGLVPDEVSIRSIQPNFKEHSVKLACVAREITAMTKFLDNLLASADLNQVYLEQHGENVVDSGGNKQVLINFSLLIREAF